MFLFGKLEIQDVEKDWKKTELITLKKKKTKEIKPMFEVKIHVIKL